MRLRHLTVVPVTLLLILAGCSLFPSPPTNEQQGGRAGEHPAGPLGWVMKHPAHSPSPRDGAAMAYDAKTRTIVLFGGMDDPGRLKNDTWTWDGSTWTEEHPDISPPARLGAMMAFDAQTGRLVLFGGNLGGMGNHRLDDTWTWDGKTWREEHPETVPPARDESAMAYDSQRKAVVLFGGLGEAALNDTWTWDGTNWTQEHPIRSPAPRWHMNMAYDAARGQVVLSSGMDGSGKSPSPQRLDDTWTWDGTNWSQQPVHSPSVRGITVYDDELKQVVFFGSNVMFTWNGDDWSGMSTATFPPARFCAEQDENVDVGFNLPPSRSGFVIAYDVATNQLILFGGDGSGSRLGDTWSFEPRDEQGH